MGDREREGLQSLVGLLQIPGPLLVGDVPLEGLAALVLAPGIEPVQGVAAFTVLGRLGPVLRGPGPAALDIGPDVDPLLGVVGVAALGVGLDVDPLLGVAGVTALDIGLDVDPLLGLTRVAALDIDPVLGLAGVAPLAVDGSLSLILVVLEGFTDHAIAALAGRRVDLRGSRRALVSRSSQSSLRHQKDRLGRPLDGGTRLPSKARGQQSHLEKDQPANEARIGSVHH